MKPKHDKGFIITDEFRPVDWKGAEPTGGDDLTYAVTNEDGRLVNPPQTNKLLLVSCYYVNVPDAKEVIIAYWNGRYFENGYDENLEDFGIIVYAYKPWPDPAPYPGGKP